MTSRIDIHRPSAIIPEDYAFVTISFRDHMGIPDPDSRARFIAHRKGTGGNFSGHAHKGGCMVCGAYMIDYAIFHHYPTNTYIRTGCDCAQHIEDGHTDAFRASAQKRRKLAKIGKEIEDCAIALDDMGLLEQVEKYFMPNDIGGAIAGCDEEQETWRFGCHIFGITDTEYKPYENSFEIIVDLVRKLRKWGISDKQIAFLKSLCKKFEDLPRTIQLSREENAKRADAPEGKHHVQVKVLNIKLVENDYGSTWKMLAEHETGYKIWSTVPSKLLNAIERDDVIEMTINLTRSNDDPKFAFGKRPSKPKLLTEVA
jgi:hypothetical protein